MRFLPLSLSLSSNPLYSQTVRPVLTQRQLDMSYPSFVINRHHPPDALGGDENAAPTCCICHAELTLGNRIRRLRCGHCFHIACGDSYLTTQQAVCPADGLTVDANGRVPEAGASHSVNRRRRRRQARRPSQAQHQPTAESPAASSLPAAVPLALT